VHPERDEACSVAEASAEPRQEYASTRSGVSGSGGGEYATIAPAPGHGTPPGLRGFPVPRIVHAHPKLLLDLSQLASYAFADRFAPYHAVPETVLPADMRESRPWESHPEPLAEPDMNLSAHPAPIKQTLQSCRYPSVRREPFVPRQAVVETGSPGPDGL